MMFIEDATEEKLRGGFYTPVPIAAFILRWAKNGNNEWDILEPSCGNGVFLDQIKKIGFDYKSVTAVELNKAEAAKAKKIRLPNTDVIDGDFYAFCNTTKKRFDLIVGNPPYIRYQFFDKNQREEAERVFERAELKYSKLTNAWVSFIVGSTLLLKEYGKIGFVVPAEILQVSYAKQLRNYLAHYFNKINIVSFRKLVFPNIQQEVVLLLCEKNSVESHMIEHLEVEDANDLKKLDVLKLKSPKKRIDFKSNKWTFYFLDQKEIDFIENIMNKKAVPKLGDFAEVEVGITTGSNDFFTVSSSVIEKYGLQEFAKPMVGRSVQVPSSIFTKEDWKVNCKAEAKSYFLRFPTKKEIGNKSGALNYIAKGESEGINKWYKNRIRDEWQTVPSAWISEALFIRRNDQYPKFVVNQAKAYTTDTMHRVTIKKGYFANKIDMDALVASYYNSLSLASSEISGRSHGGGVLELMPNEVEDILIPYRKENVYLLERIDRMMRGKKSIDDILAVTDKVILKEGLGFSDTEIKMANSIWKRLSTRRRNRGVNNHTISMKNGS